MSSSDSAEPLLALRRGPPGALLACFVLALNLHVGVGGIYHFLLPLLLNCKHPVKNKAKQ